MSRFTQFIGLTQKAEDFAKSYCEEIGIEDSYIYTFGMLEEQVRLRYFKWDGKDIKEEIQEVPWSNGTMIFTRLVLHWDKKNTTNLFDWIHNPMIQKEGKGEYDKESGEFWV
jgi:hypothetical protein